MCMEDIRIGRKTGSTDRVVAMTTNVDKVIAGPSENRIALIICNINCNVLWFSPSPMTGHDQGIRYAQGNPSFFVMTIEQFGDMVTKPWHGLSDTDGNVFVIEVFLADK